jgi:hypothetical protein
MESRRQSRQRRARDKRENDENEDARAHGVSSLAAVAERCAVAIGLYAGAASPSSALRGPRDGALARGRGTVG